MVSSGELRLQTGVGDHIVGVSPKEVSRGEAAIKFAILAKAQVKMWGKILRRRPQPLAGIPKSPGCRYSHE